MNKNIMSIAIIKKEIAKHPAYQTLIRTKNTEINKLITNHTFRINNYGIGLDITRLNDIEHLTEITALAHKNNTYEILLADLLELAEKIRT